MSATRFVVVTGTDTGVGKTWVTCAIASAIASVGRRVVAIKPIETGWGPEPSGLEDGALLASATGQSAPRRALRVFAAPVAPPEAAEREGKSLDYEGLLREVRAHAEGAEIALVETAGGALSPFTWTKTAVDLAADLGARVVLVASDRLGTIHHTRAALSVLGERASDVAAVVLSAPAEADASTGSNADALTRFTQIPIHVAPRDGASALRDLALSL
ncbi:MAG: dethiobiotin synthase [Myxococcales bacterium]|nr:dethiobiotin synthase [Myxococcales bacterium]